jgi:hypothetical protein
MKANEVVAFTELVEEGPVPKPATQRDQFSGLRWPRRWSAMRGGDGRLGPGCAPTGPGARGLWFRIA